MVKRIRLYAALALIVCTAVHAQVAPAPAAGEFYATMLRRGIVSFDAGRDVDAVRQLRIAAFGFVDSLDLYQTAEAYLALAYERSGNTDRARESARKVVAAQRQVPRYATLALPAAVRASFDALANKLLTTAEVAALRTAASGAVGTPQTATAAPSTTGPVSTPSPVTAWPAPITAPATTKPIASTPVASTPVAEKPAVTTPPATTASVTPPPATTATTPTLTTTQPEPATPKPVATAPATSDPAPSKPATVPSPDPAPPAATKPSTSPSTPATQTPREQPKSVTIEVPFAGQAPPPQAPVVKPQPAPPAVKAAEAPATTKPARIELSESEVAKRLVAAERALNAARLAEARTTYRELLAAGSLSRSTLLRVAEGLYRARDFAPALQAFRQLGPLSRGEEPYRYYIAVALYETGDYGRAKDELRAALPFIEVTPDVARYQAKIDGAVR